MSALFYIDFRGVRELGPGSGWFLGLILVAEAIATFMPSIEALSFRFEADFCGTCFSKLNFLIEPRSGDLCIGVAPELGWPALFAGERRWIWLFVDLSLANCEAVLRR